MREKCRDQRGETLIEVIASILIMTLSILLLFGAVMASARINKSAKESDEKFYSALNAAEEQKTQVTDTEIVPAGSKVKVEQKNPDTGESIGASWEGEVGFYGGEGVLSYSYPPPAGP